MNIKKYIPIGAMNINTVTLNSSLIMMTECLLSITRVYRRTNTTIKIISALLHENDLSDFNIGNVQAEKMRHITTGVK